MVDPIVILAGAIPAAALALSLDGGLTLAERMVRARIGGRRGRGRWLTTLAIAVALAAVAWITVVSIRTTTPIRVGSKNFTEQILLGELLAQTLEARGVEVERLNLGGTFICDRAIRSGDIDVYVEYTGTAYRDLPTAARQRLAPSARRRPSALRRRR